MRFVQKRNQNKKGIIIIIIIKIKFKLTYTETNNEALRKMSMKLWKILIEKNAHSLSF